MLKRWAYSPKRAVHRAARNIAGADEHHRPDHAAMRLRIMKRSQPTPLMPIAKDEKLRTP